MSSDIRGLVDRTFREYLEPMDSLESYTYLTTGIGTTETTISYDGDLLSIEEEDALDAGAIIEIGTELMYSKGLNAAGNTITVSRGARGTTAQTHSANDLIKLSPAFPRINVFNAVKDQIENLYPTLYAIEEQTIAAATGYVALTGGDDNRIVAPLKAVSQYTNLSSGSETSVQFSGVNNGVNVHCTFKKKFGDITDEDTTISSIGLETEYEPIIMAGVAAQILAGRDIPSATAEYITESMSLTTFPVNSATSIRNSLLQYQQVLINQARKDLRARFPEPVTLNSVVYPSA